MGFWSGNGGTLAVGNVTLHVNRWELTQQARLVENTHSGVSSSNYEAVVPDHSWTAEVPWDDANMPDVDVGLAEGTKVTIIFKFGASSKTATLTSTTVESVVPVDDNATDIVRVRVSGKGGALTRPTT